MSDLGTTTPATLRADFITQIRSITPSHVEYAHLRWARARTMVEVPGSEMRTFFLQFLPQEEDYEHGWDDAGRSVQFVANVWTSYAGIADDYDDSIVSEDSNQIFLALARRISPTVPGLIMVRHESWVEAGESEEGARWGAHSFLVTYMASNLV